jgi:hypothetical protein
MIRTWRWLVVSSCACILLGCPPKKPGDDAGADGAASASAVPEAAPAPVAANDSDVTKYPDQGNDYMAPLTVRMTANTRTEASSTAGKVVGQIKAGETVDEVADHGGFDLVVFPDPSDATRKLEGWAPHTIFTAQPIHYVDGGIPVPVVVDAGPTPPPSTGFVCVKQNPPGTCRAGYSVSGAVCRTTCSVASDCKGPDPKCNGGKCYASNGCGM